MSDRITYRAYWTEVDSIVTNILEESREYKVSYDDVQERVWEDVDGHQWVIYTRYHYEVLGHSENDGYTVENFGADSAVKDGQLDTAALAFGALYGDVSERLYRRLEECRHCEGDDCEDCHGLGWYDSEASEAAA